MHNNAKIGFHTNLVNDGKFDDNKGFTGFYHDTETLTISGKNKTVFNIVDVAVINNVALQTSMGVTNDFNFIEGKIITPRDDESVSLDFMNHNLHLGYDDIRHVDGYALVSGNNSFEFPIGDDDRFRPMILPNQPNKNTFKGAYFFENANTPSTFNTNFNTNEKQNNIISISQQEFWDLNGSSETTITLTWDNQSNIFVLADDLKNLRVVGWSISDKKWIDLGNTNFKGDTNKGRITSKPFIPNLYAIITIGSVERINEEICNANILFSPNDDGVNETFDIECLDESSIFNSELSIYNRWGILVHRIKSYKSNWKGISNGRSTFSKNKKLPVGTYYYMLKYEDKNGKAQLKKGWIFLNR